ncbi:UBP1-associated protein 2B [Heracleum sosnowskyi]|uniref:UBP1-associated protein 2B n=1 Tax=Heracleum sosnowskyi TaxID=360622 RepID=A0AAD8MG66_9APIA|nr:UBP1-associated protein 2B [Heracleum sosnowskyi]
MTKLKSKNKKPTKTDPKTPKKIKKQKPNRPISPNPKKPDPETLQTLLEPYTKPQLITFLIDSALKTPTVYSKIVEKAETEVSHRKLFVHGLSWDTTRQTLVSVFEKYGEIEECSLIIDKNTGKAKGFGFVVFKSRDGAKKALEVGKLRVDDRIVSCQLACVGPVGNVGGLEGFSGRKIYVSNVGKDVDSGKLREFFERFGEIEAGPLGFDAGTGKCRGYALFVYKNLDGVNRVLEEPNKVFEGVVLNCRMADSGKGGKSVSSITTVMQPLPNVGCQNVGLLGQNPGLSTMLLPQMGYNSIYGGGLVANSGGGLLGPLMGQGLAGVNQFGQMGYSSVMMGQGLGTLGVSQSVLGPYSGPSYAPVFPDPAKHQEAPCSRSNDEKHLNIIMIHFFGFRMFLPK